MKEYKQFKKYFTSYKAMANYRDFINSVLKHYDEDLYELTSYYTVSCYDSAWKNMLQINCSTVLDDLVLSLVGVDKYSS